MKSPADSESSLVEEAVVSEPLVEEAVVSEPPTADDGNTVADCASNVQEVLGKKSYANMVSSSLVSKYISQICLNFY